MPAIPGRTNTCVANWVIDSNPGTVLAVADREFIFLLFVS